MFLKPQKISFLRPDSVGESAERRSIPEQQQDDQAERAPAQRDALRGVDRVGYLSRTGRNLAIQICSILLPILNFRQKFNNWPVIGSHLYRHRFLKKILIFQRFTIYY